MPLTDILKYAYDAISGDKKAPATGATGAAAAPEEGGMLGKIVTFLAGKSDKPEIADEAKDKSNIFKKLRESFFGELGKSMLVRQFPRLGAMTDLAAHVSGKKAPERVPWQNEFETITALMILMPNSWKHHFTDLFASSMIFQALVKYWPALDGIDLPFIGHTGFLSKAIPGLGEGGSLRERILNRQPPDPDAVIQVLRIIHQDVFVTGKVSFENLKKMMSSPAAIAAILGVGGAVSAGEAALGAGGAIGAIVDKGKEALGIKGKKIADLVRENPAAERTAMQKNLLALLDQLKVGDTATLKKGDWDGNNDEITVQFDHKGKTYYLTFDNDTSSTDIRVNNTDGREIANFTDWGNFDADDSTATITQAIEQDTTQPTQPQSPSPTK